MEFCAAALMLCAALTFCSWITRPTNTDQEAAVIKAFYEQSENSIDVIGYGSSHMWRGFDPSVLREKYGLTAYNYGGNWQHINTTRLFFEDSLITQTPKIALIETYYVNSLLQDTDLVGEIYYTRYLHQSESRNAYLKQCFGNHYDRFLAYYFPFSSFHESWKNIDENSLKRIEERIPEFRETSGYKNTEKIVPQELSEFENREEEPLSEDARKELDLIVDRCRQKGIEVVFFTAPYAGTYRYGEAMRQYADAHECHYINMFDNMEEVGINPAEDYYDKGHLNSTGARKVADYLGDYIVSHCSDHI